MLKLKDSYQKSPPFNPSLCPTCRIKMPKIIHDVPAFVIQTCLL